MYAISDTYWNNEELNDLLGHAIRRMIGALDVECGREKGGGA
jgi:hypothetical protein